MAFVISPFLVSWYPPWDVSHKANSNAAGAIVLMVQPEAFSNQFQAFFMDVKFWFYFFFPKIVT